MKKYMSLLFLFAVCLADAKTEIIIDAHGASSKNEMVEVAEMATIGAVIAGVAVAAGALISKGIKHFYSAESYYNSALDLYNNQTDFVVTTPCDTPFEFERLILQKRSWMNYFWDIDTSDCYLYSAYRKLLDVQSTLEKALEYSEIAHEKSIKDAFHEHIKPFIFEQTTHLRSKIRNVLVEIRNKIQLCQYHPLYETHMKIYLKKKELKQQREQAERLEWEMRQQRMAMQEQNEILRNQQTKPSIDITIINQ